MENERESALKQKSHVVQNVQGPQTILLNYSQYDRDCIHNEHNYNKKINNSKFTIYFLISLTLPGLKSQF